MQHPLTIDGVSELILGTDKAVTPNKEVTELLWPSTSVATNSTCVVHSMNVFISLPPLFLPSRQPAHCTE